MAGKHGFAAMDPEKLKAIASAGGKASHEKGTANEFSSESAAEAGKKGGAAVAEKYGAEYMAKIGRAGGSSHSVEHMSAIGKLGGRKSAKKRQADAAAHRARIEAREANAAKASSEEKEVE